jgi:hypothetical protein
MKLSGKLGQVLLCLFALPFALGGLLVFAQAFRTNTGNAPFWVPLVLGFVFGGIGFGLMFLAIFGGRTAQRQQRLQV